MKKNIEIRNAIIKTYNDDLEHSYLLRSIIDTICLSEELIESVIQSYYNTTTVFDLLYSYLTLISDKDKVAKDDVTKEIMLYLTECLPERFGETHTHEWIENVYIAFPRSEVNINLTNFDKPSNFDCVIMSRKMTDTFKRVLENYKVLSFEAKGYTAYIKDSLGFGGTYSFSVDCDDYCEPDEYEKSKMKKYDLYRIDHKFIFSQGE